MRYLLRRKTLVSQQIGRLIDAIFGQVLAQGRIRIPQKQPIQVAAADSRAGRGLCNIQILAQIVEINKLGRALRVGIVGIFVTAVAAVQHRQCCEKAK